MQVADGELMTLQAALFAIEDVWAHDTLPPLRGAEREGAAQTITRRHYTRSVPSGKSHYFAYESALVVFSIPANPYVGAFLLGRSGAPVWELSRLWAPDGHERNLLTQAISEGVRALRVLEPDVLALVSYADPAAGHHGGIYRAASWVYLGQVTDTRYWRGPDGQLVPRRKFHSGDTFLRKPEIEALGYTQTAPPGKHRYVKGLTPGMRRLITRRHPVCTATIPKRQSEDR